MARSPFLAVVLLTCCCFQSHAGGHPLTSDPLSGAAEVKDPQQSNVSGPSGGGSNSRWSREAADPEWFRDNRRDIDKDHYEDADWHPPSSPLESHSRLPPSYPLVKHGGLSGSEDNHQSSNNRTPASASAQCGEPGSRPAASGRCRPRAAPPAEGHAHKHCPDIFRCSEDVSHCLREDRKRTEQLEQLEGTTTALRDELRDHQQQVQALEQQSGVSPQVGSSSERRLESLELRDAEVDTLLHVHDTLLQELQVQLRNLSVSVSRSVGCTVTAARNPPPHSMQNTQPPGGRALTPCQSNCASLYHSGVTRSGVYSIVVAAGVTVSVYCDMNTEGGGWTVFQRRRDGSLSFNRRWSEYRDGFGDPRGEHWLGNQHLHLLTSRGPHSLRIHLQDWAHVHRHALYHTFSVADEGSLYRLGVSGFSGTVRDSFGWYHHRQTFSTPDTGNICAEISHAGWWFHQCFYSNLNGVYYQGGHYSLKAQNLLGLDGIVWFSWKDSDFYSLKGVTMMIRPQHFGSHQSP